MLCPHCKQTALIRTSEQISPLLRELRYSCRNHECGHTFVAHTEVSYTVSPSAIPDPSIKLPFSQHVKRQDLIGQLTAAPNAQPHIESGNTPADNNDLGPEVARYLTSDQIRLRVRHIHLEQAYRMAKSLGTFPPPINPGDRPLNWRETDVQHWINLQPLPLQPQP